MSGYSALIQFKKGNLWGYCDTGKNMANDNSGPWKAPKDAFGRSIPFISDINIGGIQTNVNGSPVFTDIRAGNGDNNRADWWFYDLYNGSVLYNDPDLTVEGAALWSAGIVVNNSAADNTACTTAGGTLRDVTVEPAGSDLDLLLTGANTQPFTRGAGPF